MVDATVAVNQTPQSRLSHGGRWSGLLGCEGDQKARVVAFDDLGMEAIYEFEVEDMPVTVAVDSNGVQCAPTLVQISWKVKYPRDG